MSNSSTPFDDTEPTQKQLALLQQRQQLIALLAHDLKNPIIASQRILTMIAAGKLGEISDIHANLLTRICQSNQSLLSMINDVLDSYRLDAQAAPLNCRPLNLKHIISACISELEPLAQTKNIKLTYNLTPINPAMADEVAIHRVISNLIGNAIKYTPRDGSITIRLFDKDDRATVQVQDNGPGIASNDLQKMFDLFWQANSSDRTQGLGLGLFLCRQLMDAQHGTISCQSQLEEGTTLEISLPYAILKQRPVVLIVDDTTVTGMVLQEFLKTLLIDVHLVNSGAQALEAAKTINYNAIFMDMLMPEMDGVSTARALRKAGVRSPILAYSSYLLLAASDELKNAGFNDFLPKPVDSATLKRLVRKWIGNTANLSANTANGSENNPSQNNNDEKERLSAAS